MTNKPNIEKEWQKWDQILVRDIPLNVLEGRSRENFKLVKSSLIFIYEDNLACFILKAKGKKKLPVF